jgi:hypothetical protein
MHTQTSLPDELTINDALDAAVFLVQQEHAPDEPCAECQKTLGLLNEVKERLADKAIGNNLIVPAYNAARKIEAN